MPTYRIAAVAVTAVVALTACGDDGTDAGHGQHGSAPSATATADRQPAHNDADVAFAQGMIPHHRQAVEMADLAATRASSREVKDLAAAIKRAQDPEIRTMTGWLTLWGEPVPSPGADHGGHGGHGGMPGMMSPEQMQRLRDAEGKAFDTAFLELMIEHHRGAVTMAETERAKGAFPAARQLAATIITTQNAEITRMTALLDG
ncbi:MAG TPA: DUF305 domain-containing protein [Thermomonospora sp.]|nr:DUF305 domain-containing protein [Thermomonospora sp.]